VPQAKGAFQSFIKRPSKFVDVICGHYANDGVLADACAKSELPIINTEYAHSLGTAMGELEHKYDLFRQEPKIAGGSVWSYQDQSILTRHFDQQNQVLKGVRIDSVRYIDSYGLNPVPEGRNEKGKEGADGVVYGDGYPQEDYFLLAQVYTPVYIYAEGISRQGSRMTVEVENRFDFIPLQGYRIEWQLKDRYRVTDSGTAWLTAPAREKETIMLHSKMSNMDEAEDLILCMRVVAPDGTQCFQRHVSVVQKADYAQLLREATGNRRTDWLEPFLKQGFLLRVGREIGIGLDYRRKNLWDPYLLKPKQLKVKKVKNTYLMTCHWERNDSSEKHVINGEIIIQAAKDGTVQIDYTLTPSERIGGKFLDYGLTWTMPSAYTDVAWLGQGPYSQTPDKTAYNNRDVWQLSKDDIRFYGNRSKVDFMTLLSPQTDLSLHSQNGSLLMEQLNGFIYLTDNLVVGSYGTKFKGPQGMNANQVGVRKGRLVMKADARSLQQQIFGQRRLANAEQPYLKSYGK
jgi:beta-galactosidase